MFNYKRNHNIFIDIIYKKIKIRYNIIFGIFYLIIKKEINIFSEI